MERLTIAIDGPAGAGKSTVARRVAQRLGYLYIDTGAMYRALTLAAQRRGVSPYDEDALAKLARVLTIAFAADGNGQRVLLDGEDVTDAIRAPDVTAEVSHVARHPLVREVMVEKQRELARDGGIVMDGRDIGTHVLPNADIKIYLTASIDERARRRQREMEARGYHVALETVKEEIARRDRLDSERAVAPLQKAADARLLDTTGLSVDDVVEEILAMCRTRGREGE